ncbi:membrane protein DedA with SNARE-associated domain [Scopulibacillus daqui]|uniref:Membrane protein DedA with SNARE-associated domain n=1 Tax=Scopulibacillus daqui TaxID=1469162 RepID=A0ABS2PXG6_9BACL|nr:DedA family protein [Scopulibacillus daqui]MBM7644651.1 membrane protein DedA with SNARE-associated domain [Scopulibacillus daqui]
MAHFEPFLITYGYFAIFFLLFFGITGIPSPEESFMVFIGIAISQNTLNLYSSLGCAFLGVFSGMITSYFIGKYIGKPFINKFGKYVGLTPERWEKAETKYKRHAAWTIAFGYFIPGIRQINPYLAGISRSSLITYIISSAIGGAVWVLTFIFLGYFLGNKIQQYLTFKPQHLAIIAGIFLLIFAVATIIHIIRIKKKEND